MVGASVLKTVTSAESPLDGSVGDGKAVSSFLTIQSLTNFAAMTGAVSAAWQALGTLDPALSAVTVPYVLAFAWGGVSVALSWDALKKDGKTEWTKVTAAVFIAFLNSLVLAGAVVGTGSAIGTLGGGG